MRKDDLDRIEKWAATSFTLLLTLILCGPAAVAQSTAINANGVFVNAFGCSESQTSIDCIFVDVNTGSTNGQKTTFLIYDHSITDLNGFLLEDTSGFGTIPNSTFSGTRSDRFAQC